MIANTTPTTSGCGPTQGEWYRPSVEISERSDELQLIADLPGASAGNIDVHFEDGELTISARVPQRQSGDLRFVYREYGVGDFRRSFRVSDTIDASRIRASYEQGVLTLHLPKMEAAKPRKIDVQLGSN